MLEVVIVSYHSHYIHRLKSFYNNKKFSFLFRYTEDMELEDAVHTAILTLKEGYCVFAIKLYKLLSSHILLDYYIMNHFVHYP